MSAIREMLRKAKGVLLRRGVPFDDVEDLVQEAFARIAEYEREEHIRCREAILVTAAVNIAKDSARRQRRAPFSSPAHDIDAIIDANPGPDEVLAARERLRRLSEGLNALNEKSRRILLARRIDGISVAEIAEREDMSRAAVEKQIARATMRLMTWVEE